MKHFTVRIRKSETNGKYYHVLQGLNGEDVYVHTKDNGTKQGIKRLCNKWFPGVEIIDETLKRPRKSGLNIILS